MSELNFIILALNHWVLFVLLSSIFMVLLFLAVHKVIAGLGDPLVLILVLAYSVNYAVVMLLWILGESSFLLNALVMGYGVVMLGLFRWVSLTNRSTLLSDILFRITPNRIGSLVFFFSLFVYISLSFLIINSIGLGIFAETNRFDAARGFGAYVRLLDFLSPFIISYSAASIFSSSRRKLIKMFALAIFIFYSSLVSGAKISIIFSLFTIFFALNIMQVKVKIRPAVIVVCLLAGIAFSILALNINLKLNNVEEGPVETGLSGAGLVVQKFAYRILASGDSSYLLLPNEVIDKIEKDSVLVRFVVPFIGITTASKIFGYPVDDYSVGRQALLYYDPQSDIAGGPTSHFDLFGYVYFGSFGGFLFAAGVGALLGLINRSIRFTKRVSSHPPNNFRIALLATLWTRSVLVIVEPTVALAYIVEVLVFFSMVSFCMRNLFRRPMASMAAASSNLA